MWYGTPWSVAVRISTLSPAFTLEAVAYPSIPLLKVPAALLTRQSVVPGKQFSTTMRFPVEHERARGVPDATWPASEVPAEFVAFTA